MVRQKDTYKARTAAKFKLYTYGNLYPPDTPKSTTEFRSLKKEDRERFRKVTSSPNTRFPGQIKGSLTYKKGTPGLFTKSVKGQDKKQLIEKSVDDAIKKMMEN